MKPRHPIRNAFLLLLTLPALLQAQRISLPAGEGHGVAQASLPPPQQVFPSLVINSEQTSNVAILNQGNSFMEGAPWVKPGGWRSYFFSTFHTNMWSTPASLADDNLTSLDLSPSNPNGYGPTIVSCPLSWWYNYYDPSTLSNTNLQFRRNYNGICSLHSLSNTSQGNVVIGFSHNENKNEQIKGGYYYQNTILPSVVKNLSDPLSYSGYGPDGTYHDGWNAYFAFVCMQWIPDSASTNWANKYFWEEGPVAWPAAGYVTADGTTHASSGCRSPYSIIAGNYIYIYYQDAGIKVIRVPVSQALNETAYQVYYNGNWYASLPAGCNRDNMMNYLKVPGPSSSSLFVDDGGQFTVAHITNTNYYLGMEQIYELQNNVMYMNTYLRLSTDLVSWSGRLLQIDHENVAGSTAYNGPVFLNQNGWTNTEIDLNNFYILGSTNDGGSHIYRMKLSMSLQSALPVGTIGGDMRKPHGSEAGDANQADAVQIKNEYDRIAVSFPKDRDGVVKTASIYDMQGKLVKRQVFEASEDNFSVPYADGSKPGMYLFTLEYGNELSRLKFLIH
jgi:hypothetical protein